MSAQTRLGSSASRLVILRGNSGSGKSALASALRAARPKGTLAIVGQDTIRRTILGTGDDLGTTAIGLIDLAVRYALTNGFDVVVEGILNADRYGDMLATLRADHVGITRAYLYDLSFEETVRRHATKGDLGFSEEEMRSWWHGFQPVPELHEEVIPEDQTLAEALRRVLSDGWGVTDQVERARRHHDYRG